MGDDQKPESKTIFLMEKVKFILPIFTIVSVLIGLLTFFGLKPERKKVLEWEYLSKSSLVNTSAASADKIKIFYDTREMSQVTVISARLINSGNLPIESADIKDGAFPTITFPPSIKLIAAEIKERNPSNIIANAFVLDNYLNLQHGLLNPADYLRVQIIVEGEVGDFTSLPPMSCRIAGVKHPLTKYSSVASDRKGIAYFAFHSVTELLVLCIASILPLLSVAVVGAMIGDIVTQIRQTSARPSRLFASITEGLNPKEEMTSGTRDAIAVIVEPLYGSFGPKAKEVVMRMEVQPGETCGEYFNRLKLAINQDLRSYSYKRWPELLKNVEVTQFLAPIGLTILFGASVLVMIGSWYRFLAE